MIPHAAQPAQAEAAGRGRLPRAALMPVVISGAIWGAMNLACVLFFSYAPLLMVAQGSSPTVAASLTSLAIWFTILAIPAGGYLVHRSGRPITAIIACSLIAAAALMLFVADFHPTIACLIFGVAIGPMSGAILSLPARVLEPADRSVGFGLFYTCFYVLMAAGPTAAGRLQDAWGSPSAALVASAALLASMVPLVALFLVGGEALRFRAAEPRSKTARGVVRSPHTVSAGAIAPSALHRVVGIELDLQSALPAIEEHGRVAERGGLDRDRHALLLPERRDAADMIAGEPFGIGRAHHLRGLAAEGDGELLHADFAVRRHHDADRLAVDLGHQRLQHPERLDAERLGRLQADAVGGGIIDIGCAARTSRRAFPAPWSQEWF